MNKPRLKGKDTGADDAEQAEAISASARPFAKTTSQADAVSDVASKSGGDLRRVIGAKSERQGGRSISLKLAQLALITSLALPAHKASADQPGHCPREQLPDGRIAREGTCVLGIETEHGTVKTTLENALVIINRGEDDVTVTYGAVRVLAGTGEQPTFTARRGEKYVRFNVSKDGTLWVQDTGTITKVTAQTNEGQIAVNTSEDIPSEFRQILNAGEFEVYTLTDNEGASCSYHLPGAGGVPEKDLKLIWLALINGLALTLRRRKRG